MFFPLEQYLEHQMYQNSKFIRLNLAVKSRNEYVLPKLYDETMLKETNLIIEQHYKKHQ